MSPGGERLLVVSHPNTATPNQGVYLKLLERGWDVSCIVPAHWKDSYRPEGFTPQVLPGLEGRIRFLPVAMAGSPQRHFYLANPWRHLRQLSPEIAFLEQEPFSIPALQWGACLRSAGIPLVLQADENLDRPFPWPAIVIRRWLLPRTDGIAARSPRAAEVQRMWGATGIIRVVPHTPPPWSPQPRVGAPAFTVGFAGRLVAEKGMLDLIDAVRRLADPVKLLVIGDGPMRQEIERVKLPNAQIEVRTGVLPEQMPAAYAEMDVLVLPSRTTLTWAEQYGRVLIEAMLCERPVIGSDSGEIPWVIGTTGGGMLFREGDRAGLAAALEELQAAPDQRRTLARRGREAAQRIFGLDACADALDALLREVLGAGVPQRSSRRRRLPSPTER